jgi:hypothetical protein
MDAVDAAWVESPVPVEPNPEVAVVDITTVGNVTIRINGKTIEW